MKNEIKHRLHLLLLALLLFGNVWAQIPLHYRQQLTENSPVLRAQRKSVEAYYQSSLKSGYLPEPTLGVGWFLLPVETRLEARYLRFSVNQMLPWVGSLKAERRLADAAFHSQEMHLQAATAREWATFSKTYWSWFEWQAWYSIEEQNLQWLEQFEPILRSRLGAGAASMADYLRLDVRLQEVRLALEALKQKVYPWQVKLNRMLDRPDSTSIVLPDTLLPPDSLWLVVDSQMMNDHPQVQAIQHQWTAAGEQRTLAKLLRKPRLEVGLDYMVVSKLLTMSSSQNAHNMLMPMFSVSLPLWGKRYQAAEAESIAWQQRLEYELTATVNELQSNWAEVRFELWESYRWYYLYASSIEKLNTTLQLLISSYAQSGQDFEEVLRLQQQLFEYKKKQISAYVRFQQAKAEWEYLNTQTY